MIHVLSRPASESEIADMMEALGTYIKLAVDIRKDVLAGGGEMHADCESVLLDNGTCQEDVWGADWFPESQGIRYESLINIRPKQGNRGLAIQDEDVRNKVDAVIMRVFGGSR